jgi:large subunit ribosomal protein L22
MGARKREMADRMKEERKSNAFAKLNNEPSSPRKMRLVADIIRGKEVFMAL